MKRKSELTLSRLSERIENFNRAFEIYKDAVEEFDINKILTHMALVQTFEVCFELAWKCLKDYMAENGIVVNYPKEVIKEAFNKETIKNGQLWIDMLKVRNSTSYEYNMDKVNKYLSDMRTVFYDELTRFHSWLGEINE